MKRLLYILLATALLGAAVATALTLPASASHRYISVCPVAVAAGLPCPVPLQQVAVPHTPGAGGTTDPAPSGSATGDPSGGGGGGDGSDGTNPGTQSPSGGGTDGDTSGDGSGDGSGGDEPRRKKRRSSTDRARDKAEALAKRKRRSKGRRGGAAPGRNPMRRPDGTPTRSNPGYFEGLPSPSLKSGVPNFVIRKFRVPPFLLPIYQAAGIQYGVRWEILAAINEIETNYGMNLNVSSAGALGWMQFIPSSWRAYGVDANEDGVKDPYNPVDAIFAAARYLKAAGYQKNVRRAIFAYNHADWYVDSVMLRARLIAGVPSDLVGSLTGLTEARPPVAAKVRYADDLQEREQNRRVKRGENPAKVIQGQEDRRGIHIFAREGAPVVAVNDGVVKKIGRSKRLGRYVVLQDVYGNRFTFANLGKLSEFYPVPKDRPGDEKKGAKALRANAPRPSGPASAGRQVDDSDSQPATLDGGQESQDATPVKERLFAHPNRPNSYRNGGQEQLLDSKARGGRFSLSNYFARPVGLNAADVHLKPLKEGAHVIGGTILARIAPRDRETASHLYFEIRPAGKGAPRIDPKPILDGWHLLAAAKVYRPSGKNVLTSGVSIGQILLMPKPLLENRVLTDERIDICPCGRKDIHAGEVDRRVLATLAVLAESGFRPGVTSLKCGHSVYTSSGNVSHHSSGNAVDIAQVNGVPILGHQERGGIAEQTIKRLLTLQGTLQADQIISLLDLGGPTVVMADHADHIHVGFRPLFGANKKLGRQTLAVLKPRQWSNLISRLRSIDNPVVPTKPSKYAIPVKKRAGGAHRGE